MPETRAGDLVRGDKGLEDAEELHRVHLLALVGLFSEVGQHVRIAGPGDGHLVPDEAELGRGVADEAGHALAVAVGRVARHVFEVEPFVERRADLAQLRLELRVVLDQRLQIDCPPRVNRRPCLSTKADGPR